MEDDASIFRQTNFVNQHNNAEFQANTRDRGKSCSNFLLKLCVIALFLSVIPLFPSDPPEFISQTVFAKSWELIHLLVIGIALSYGLFCRPKTARIPPKTQSSQPFESNILQHSSIFDYEEGNPSGVPDRNAIPTKSFDLSHYGKEPFLNLRRGDCRSFDERPLGLPVRSLRSRVVDSDSEEEQEPEEEECASDCESDISKSFSNVSGSTKDENLGRSVGNFSPILGKSESMRSDYYMTGNGKVEAKQVKFQSFRSPEQEASSCPRVAGFCSWLPESPNMMGRENSWRENNFYKPFSNFTQVNDFNLAGLSPNSQNSSTKFFMPSAAVQVQPSVPFSAGDFASSYTTYNHKNGHLSNPQYVNGNTSAENSRFFMPSPSVPPSDFASMSRRYNYDAENWSRSPNLQNDPSGGWNLNSFMPTAEFPPSMPSSADDFAPSVRTSEREKLNHGSSPKTKDETRSEEKQNVLKENIPRVINPLIPHSGDQFSTGNSPNSGNGDSGGEKLNPSISSPVNEFVVSRSARLKNGPPVLKDEEKSEKKIVGGEKLNPSVFSDDNEFSVSRGAKYKNGPPVQKDEEKSEKNNVGGEKLNPSVFSDVNKFPASWGAKLKHRTSVQKDEEKSENNNVSGEKFNPSYFTFCNEFAASRGAKFKQGRSVQKDEKSVEDNVASHGEGSNSSVPQIVDPLSVPIPKVKVSPKKNEQRKIPLRWDDDCFVIPLLENNDIEDDLVQENPSLEISDTSSEAPSSARSSSRMSVHEQNSPHKEAEENIQWSVPRTNSEIEDLAGKNESYKPSTPSPQIQTRRNNLSVELSSRTLGSQSLINNDDQGSPPTTEGRKALSKASHSRGFSCGSFFDRDLRKSLKDEAKEANRKTKGDHQFARGSKCGCLMLDVKPTFNKANLKGKSVRTIRPKGIANDRQKNDHNKHKREGDDAGERKEENPEMVVIKIGISEKRSNSNGRKGEKLQGSGGTSILVGLNSKPNSNGTAVVPIVHELKEEENDSEIDKKADEFIAKFKEQIRLQKVTARGESSRHQKSLYHT